MRRGLHDLHVESVLFVKPVIGGRPNWTVGRGQRALHDRGVLAGDRLSVRREICRLSNEEKDGSGLRQP